MAFNFQAWGGECYEKIAAVMWHSHTTTMRVLDLNERIEASREIESLLSGFNGRYIPAGPSGLITRGRNDVLPVGCNFYSLDPHRVSTRTAWEVGKRLAGKNSGKIPG
ncbi:cobaltochelatase subunit CobN [Desulfofundulus thermosubterraneus]|uniref:CobN/Magnesium Chelatase n=1 Tax=Desulfofundulus thermosubterraneus DSM 16057 TaxID=1121432 RepID=A0A1M6EGC3_9FIRM|nr:cobaltochelatase subunit CobN [Desulfofundulus thermosubterraneus]SHI84348.1 CobN/Magnesium Chelatase [Desulfofundulus thermosubterraneus DSM 16057]